MENENISPSSTATTHNSSNKRSLGNFLGGDFSLSKRRRVLRSAILAFFVIYALLTIAPFYFLFVRTFIDTKDSTDLHLWPPPIGEISMDAGIGNLSIFYNLDLQKVKDDWGIPNTEYLNPKWKLSRIAEEYSISQDTIREYLRPFGRYNGWIVLFSNEDFWPSILRTMTVTVLGVVGLSMLGIFTGTGLAGLRYGYQRFFYALYLLEVVIPPFLILLPQFYMVNKIQALIPGSGEPGTIRNISQLAVIVALYIKGGALSTMIYTSAIGAIPRDLEESAEIDGASRWQYIWYILLPLMKVPIASLTVIVLPFFWNDFLQPFVYLDPKNSTLLPLIQSFTGQYTTNFQIVFTGVFISIIPLVLIYILFRKWFVAGVMEGAIKG
ncbi:MAG: carbohydrate ABC transporter permease [Chloroflexota bacterium]|nr:carbohydrate ABC transporter permease [Chloroflexota bacterium]